MNPVNGWGWFRTCRPYTRDVFAYHGPTCTIADVDTRFGVGDDTQER